MRTDGDTEVVLEAFLEWGEQAVHRLRGEYAFAIVERATGRTYLARDPLGVKPLYWSTAGGRLHVASEVKALVPVGAPIVRGAARPARLGRARRCAGPGPATSTCCALGEDADAHRRTRPRRSASSGTRCPTASGRDSDTDLPVAVILSGGLDSSLTLLHVREMHPDCVAFTIGSPHSEDLHYARRLTRSSASSTR